MLIFAVSCENNDLSTEDEASTVDEFLSMQDGLITLKSGAVVEKKGDVFYWNGDMMLSQKQLETLDEHGDYIIEEPRQSDFETETLIHPVYNIPIEAGENNTAIPRAFGIYPTPYNMWAMVRFVYASNLTNDRRNIIRLALQHWEANTNVRFYNATGQPTVDPTYGFAYPYIEFVNSTVNNSYVGRIGGRQVVNIAAWQATSVAIHEIGHAIGLRHEQNRYDRDNSININLANVPNQNRHNFNKYTTNYFAVGSIDYNSIMMYNSFGFAINSAIPVMTRKSNGSTWTGGTILSTSDRSWPNHIYLPYIARSDTYRELAPIVYKSNNTIMTPQERLNLQAQLNNGNPNPPNCCRLPNTF
jgi:hypothetical protein